MRLDYESTKKFVRLECESIKKGVVFHYKGDPAYPGPHSDGRNIHIEYPDAAWNNEQWIDWEYEVQHEIGHESPENHKPHWQTVVNEKKFHMQTLFGSMYNLMSDHVQEHNRIGKYPGRDDILRAGRAQFVGRALLTDEVLSKPKSTKDGQMFKVVSIYDTKCREAWNPMLSGVSGIANATLQGDERLMWDKIEASGLRLQDMRNEWDAYEMAKKIIDLFDDSEKREQEARDKASQEKKDGEHGKGQGREQGDGDGEAMAEIESMSYHQHKDAGDPEGNQYNNSMQGCKIIYDRAPAPDYSYIPREFRAKHAKDLQAAQYVTADYEHAIKSIDAGRMLAGKVKRLLTSMKQVVWNHGMRRGRISGKNLWKGTKAGGYSQEVFRQKASKLDVDTAVTLLVDTSGSMSGDKFMHAAMAGVRMNDVCQQIGAPCEVLCFSDSSRNGLHHMIVRGYNEAHVSEDEMIHRFSRCANFMSMNADGEALLWAYNRIIKREKKRRLIVVLSDGKPAASHIGGMEDADFLLALTKKIEKESPVELYGIGIMDSSVEKYYTDHAVLNEASELESILIKLIKNKMIGD